MKILHGLLIALCISIAAFGQDTQVEKLPGVHERDFREPAITHLAFSPDSGRLVAAYYVAAMNRPGTDWRTWTAQWDLKTGQRTILTNATGPLAFSLDGQTLAMGYYERSRESLGEMRPRVRLALWQPSENKPTRILGDETDASVVAVAVHPDGKRLASATDDGQVLLWLLTPESKPQVIDALKTRIGHHGWGGEPLAARLEFDGEGRRLTLIAPVTPGTKTTWRIDVEKRTYVRVETEALKPDIVAAPRNRALPERPKLQVTSPDGKLRAHADDRGVIILEDAASGEKIRELRLDDDAVPKHTIIYRRGRGGPQRFGI